MKNNFGVAKIVLLLSVLALGACQNNGRPSRDFNELIPRMMGAIQQTTPEQAAENLFNVTSPDERRDAIAYLESKPWGHQPPYMNAYKLLATDPHTMVRGQALRALGTSRDPSVIPIILKYLNDSDVSVRRDATYALSYDFNETAAAALVDFMKKDPKEPDDQVRINVVYDLRNSHSPQTVRTLLDALDDATPAVVFYAHQSLVSVTSRDLGYDARSWLPWYQQTYMQTTTHPAG